MGACMTGRSAAAACARVRACARAAACAAAAGRAPGAGTACAGAAGLSSISAAAGFISTGAARAERATRYAWIARVRNRTGARPCAALARIASTGE